jgi:hypothetical protein
MTKLIGPCYGFQKLCIEKPFISTPKVDATKFRISPGVHITPPLKIDIRYGCCTIKKPKVPCINFTISQVIYTIEKSPLTPICYSAVNFFHCNWMLYEVKYLLIFESGPL